MAGKLARKIKRNAPNFVGAKVKNRVYKKWSSGETDLEREKRIKREAEKKATLEKVREMQ